MSKKKIELADAIKHDLRCYRDITDEYETACDIDFILAEPCTFKVFDEEITIDRIKMYSEWSEINLGFANEKRLFRCFKVPKNFINAVFCRVEKEQDGGFLKGWEFTEYLLDMLRA